MLAWTHDPKRRSRVRSVNVSSDFPVTAPPAQRTRLRLAVWNLIDDASADGEEIVPSHLLLHDNVIEQMPTKIGYFTDFMASDYHTALGSSRG